MNTRDQLLSAWADIDERFPEKRGTRALAISKRVAEQLALEFQPDEGDRSIVPLMTIFRPAPDGGER